MVQDEVTWALETIRQNWPGVADTGLYGDDEYGDGLYYSDDGYPPNLYRINRDEPEILETGERRKSLEFAKGISIGASKASRSSTAAGTEYRNRVETIVDVRVEGLTSKGGEWGHIDATTDLETIVRYAQHALLQERSYPTIEDDDNDAIGSVAYHSLFVENETDNSQEGTDYFRRDWQIRLVGYSNPDES